MASQESAPGPGPYATCTCTRFAPSTPARVVSLTRLLPRGKLILGPQPRAFNPSLMSAATRSDSALNRRAKLLILNGFHSS
jgi:hypothetical protein